MNAPHGKLVQELIHITQQLLKEKFGPLANNSAALAGSIAQRVNPDIKIESSIECVQQNACRKLKLTHCFFSVIVKGCHPVVLAVNNVLRAGETAFLQTDQGYLTAGIP